MKPLAIVSGIGGILIGGAAVIINRKKKAKAFPPPIKLPDDAQWIIMKSAEFGITSDEKKI